MKFIEKNGTLELALRAPDEKRSVMLPSATWETLADYVLQNHGASIEPPQKEEDKKEKSDAESTKKSEDEEESKPSIQIIRGGKEL